MKLDIRYPIGLLFVTIGAILAVYGAASSSSVIYAQHSTGININLWWGLLQVVFGAIMVALARHGARKG